jgi:hypothetical protein
MEIVRDDEQLARYVRDAVQVSGDTPVLIDQYLARATEVDVDAICDGEQVFVAGVLEHIEEAGVHSGDSACSLPPFSLRPETIAELHRQTEAMARALNVRGLMNVQFAIEEPLGPSPRIYVLEVNPRASRTVPFVAKAIGLPVAAIAAKVMAGAKLADFDLTPTEADHMAVKEAVFPFARFPGVDTVLGPEMRSTGEVMGLDWRRDGEATLEPAFARAFLKGQLAGGVKLPQAGAVFVSVREADKPLAVEPARLLLEQGFRVLADRRHRRPPARRRPGGHAGQEGAGGPPQHRRRHEERRGPAGLQHHRGPPVAGGQLLAPPHRADDEDPLLHNGVRGARHGPRRSPPCAPTPWTCARCRATGRSRGLRAGELQDRERTAPWRSPRRRRWCRAARRRSRPPGPPARSAAP